MDEMLVKTVEVTGSAKPKAWSQAQTVSNEKNKTLIVVSLIYKGEGELVDLAQIGTGLLESLVEKGEVTEKDIKEIGEEIEVSALVGKYAQGELSVSGRGKTEIFIWREGKVGKVWEGKEKIGKTKGPVKIGDRFIVITKAFEEYLTMDGIKKFLGEGLTEMENLAVLMHRKEDSSRMAVIMAKVEEEDLRGNEPVKYERSLRLGDWRDKLSSVVQKLSWQKPLVIKEEKRRWNTWIGLGLITLLVIGVLSGMVRRSKLIKERAYSQMESSVNQKMKEASSIVDLNPERAKLLLSQGTIEVEKYLEETKDEVYRNKALNLSTEMKKIETNIFRKQEVTLNTLTELSLLRNGLSAEKMFLDTKGNLMLPDTNATQIEVMNLEDKSNLQIDTGDLGKVKELASYNKKIYGIVDGGIFVMQGSEKNIAIQPDELWKEVTLIDVFGGNVYLLDRGQSEIWKYPVLTDGFGTRRRWLGAGIQLDLSNVVDMKVDGDIWLITNTGKLEKYSRGVPVDFSMEGFPAVEEGKLVSPSAIFLTDDKVYVLEAGAGRVVVFDKESGKYDKQYATEELKEGKDLVVYKDKAYVLISDKIVWFQL